MSRSTNVLGGATPAPSHPTSSHPATSLVPAKDEALQKAIQEYVEKISTDDKAAFKSAPDIIKRLQEMQSSTKSRISSSLITRIERVLQCIKHFISSLTIFIQHSPEISSLVVGGVNCILTLVLGYIEFFERLTRMMERIGTHLAYLTEYSKAPFQNSDKLRQALVEAYCDLLEFYIKARKVFSNKKGEPSYSQGFKLFFRLTWEPFEAQFSSIEANFLDHTLAIVRLATVNYQNRSLEYQKREDEIRRLEEEKEADRIRRKILRWLSLDDFERTYERHFKKRFENTGQWLLNDPRFINWRDGVKSSLLWCHGAPGSGKTVLASLVIEHLSALCELSEGTGITFVYCNYKESRTTTAYISSALKQLCRTMQFLPPGLQDIYKQHYKNDSRPKYEELRKLFLAVIQQLGCVYFVVDALDECTADERKNLCAFLLNITDIASTQNTTKLFVTSRKESDIEQVFQRKAIPAIEIEATKVDSDIEVYVKAQMDQRLQNGSLRIKDMALKDKIFHTLTTEAGGIFLWVEFQLDAICAEFSDKGIARALARVPEDMSTTYERILQAISEKPRAQRELARKVLIWAAYARRPLPIEALTSAISIEKNMRSLEELKSCIPTERDILSACANLISVDQSHSRYVRFVHFSIQEFLTSHRSKYIETLNIRSEVAHREIAQACIIFLTLFPKQRDCLGLYALDEWPNHLVAGNLNSLPVDDQMVTLALSFFDTNPMVLTKQPPFNEMTWYLIKAYIKFLPPLLALMFDLPGAQKRWPLKGKQLEKEQSVVVEDLDLNCMIVSDDKLAMHYAAAELDSVPVAQRLYNYGYPIDYTYCGDNRGVPAWLRVSPLFSIQSIEMARFLLDNGTSTKPQREYFSLTPVDPLKIFIERGNLGVEVFQLLLDKAQHGETFWRVYSALRAAVSKGNVEVTRLLLDKGVEVNVRSSLYSSGILHAAVYGGHVEIVRLLLNHGADVNFQRGMSDSVLHAAVRYGNLEVIRLLLDKEADVNIQGGKYGSTLQTAALGGNVEIVRLLLSKGANVHARGGKYGTVLQAALAPKRWKLTEPNRVFPVVELLLDHGADITIHAPDSKYRDALTAARQLWKKDRDSFDALLKLLISRGWEGDEAESLSDNTEVLSDKAQAGSHKSETLSDRAEGSFDAFMEIPASQGWVGDEAKAGIDRAVPYFGSMRLASALESEDEAEAGSELAEEWSESAETGSEELEDEERTLLRRARRYAEARRQRKAGVYRWLAPDNANPSDEEEVSEEVTSTICSCILASISCFPCLKL